MSEIICKACLGSGLASDYKAMCPTCNGQGVLNLSIPEVHVFGDIYWSRHLPVIRCRLAYPASNPPVLRHYPQRLKVCGTHNFPTDNSPTSHLKKLRFQEYIETSYYNEDEDEDYTDYEWIYCGDCFRVSSVTIENARTCNIIVKNS